MVENSLHIFLLMIYHVETMSKKYEELGIGYIGSYLRECGYRVSYLAVNEDEIDYVSIFSAKPDVIGLPTYFASKECIYRFSAKLKQIMPETVICIGGVFPTYNANKALQECSFIDYAIKGEGETVFLELVKHLESQKSMEGIKGLVYRKGRDIIANEMQPLIQELDSLPVPARDIIIQNKLKIAHISTSRGCMARCTFCTSQLFWQKWRGRNMINVVNEIEYIVNHYGIHVFNVIDNSFEDDIDEGQQRLHIFAQEIIRRKLDISYFANFRSEFHKNAEPSLMNLLTESGLGAACIGLEAANNADLKLYGKMASVDDNVHIMNLFIKHQIIVDPGFINFNPYSTFEGLWANIEFLQKYHLGTKIYNVANSFQMYKGTRLFYKTKQNGLIKGNENNPHSYSFENQKIEALYHYIISYRDRVNHANQFAFDVIGSYVSIYKMLVYHIRKIAVKQGDSIAYKIINNHLHALDCIFNELSRNTCEWFKNLISMAKYNWSILEAGRISNEYLNHAYIGALPKTLNKLYIQFIMDITRYDRKYNDILNRIL